MIAFPIVPLQMTGADALALGMPFCKLLEQPPWNPLCFVKPKIDMHFRISRIATDSLWRIFRLCSSSVTENKSLDLFLPFTSGDVDGRSENSRSITGHDPFRAFVILSRSRQHIRYIALSSYSVLNRVSIGAPLLPTDHKDQTKVLCFSLA